MAIIKKTQIRPEDGNDYETILYPETSTDMVIDEATGKTVATFLADAPNGFATLDSDGQVPQSQLGNVLIKTNDKGVFISKEPYIYLFEVPLDRHAIAFDSNEVFSTFNTSSLRPQWYSRSTGTRGANPNFPIGIRFLRAYESYLFIGSSGGGAIHRITKNMFKTQSTSLPTSYRVETRVASNYGYLFGIAPASNTRVYTIEVPSSNDLAYHLIRYDLTSSGGNSTILNSNLQFPFVWSSSSEFTIMDLIFHNNRIYTLVRLGRGQAKTMVIIAYSLTGAILEWFYIDLRALPAIVGDTNDCSIMQDGSRVLVRFGMFAYELNV